MTKIFSDIHFDDVPTPKKAELKALAKATAESIADPTNTTIAVMLGKNGKIIKITR